MMPACIEPKTRFARREDHFGGAAFEEKVPPGLPPPLRTKNARVLHFAFCIFHFAFFILHFDLCTLHFALCTLTSPSSFILHPSSFIRQTARNIRSSTAVFNGGRRSAVRPNRL